MRFSLQCSSRRPESWLLRVPYEMLDIMQEFFLSGGAFLHPLMCMRVGCAWPQHSPQVAKHSSDSLVASSLNSVSDQAS